MYLELRRRLGRVREGAISYYVTGDGHEVDFVVGDRDEPHVAQLVQSCVSLRDAPTRVRELRALNEAMTELGRRDATIVTLYERDTVEVGAGTVEVVPAWRWLLGLEQRQAAVTLDRTSGPRRLQWLRGQPQKH